ncbi:MOSC domain-containing protein [Tabrizicola aquatica]|uniref:MOSC domain-containing protein n=1 Tax=Tabrizicola aquatica TaxID=909926 RepID=UPI000CD2E1CC|nr:sulfurase [Tabrizicola aquatica]
MTDQSIGSLTAQDARRPPFFVQLKVTGQVTYLGLVRDRAASLASAQVDEIVADAGGAVGDSHHGIDRASCMRLSLVYAPGTMIRNTRQITIVSDEELAEVAQIMGIAQVSPAALGATIRLCGIPALSLLPPSTRLLFSSGAALVVDLENAPCNHPARLIDTPATGHPGFRQAAAYRRGVCAWVERPGLITANATVTVHVPSQPPYPHMP